MPEVLFYTGKWEVKERGVILYLIDDEHDTQYYVQPTEKALKYIENRIVTNHNFVGEYSNTELTITYKIDLSKHSLVLDSIPKLTNYIRLSILEKEFTKPVNILIID